MNEKLLSEQHDDDREPTAPSSRVLSALGQTSIEKITEVPQIPGVRVEGIGLASYAPAGAEPYVGQARRGIEIRGEHQAEEAIAYAGTIFPDSNFSFLGSGRYGVVLADQTGKAFKIRRTALDYSRCEKEAGALKLLSDAGLAPTFYMLVDASKEYRLDRKAYNYTAGGFGDVEIPRQDSGRELPVIVMDAIDPAPLETADPDQLVDGVCRVADLFLRNGIISWDLEVMTDKRSGGVVILDAGELSQRPLDPGASPRDSREHERDILRSVLFDFGLSRGDDVIIAAYERGGLDAMRKFLLTTMH